MSEHTIVPDSIEPILGYKALSIVMDGLLTSPSKHVDWPVKQRLEAICTGTRQTWTWMPVEGTPHPGSWAGRPKADVPEPRPSNPLPPGWYWSWEPITHTSPEERCQCGIYVVDDPGRCLSYMQQDGIIAEIALWGKVIPAANGARGQYAYPSKLLVAAQIADEVKYTAELYGVPMVVLDADDPVPEPEPPPQPLLWDALTNPVVPGDLRDAVAKALYDGITHPRQPGGEFVRKP